MKKCAQFLVSFFVFCFGFLTLVNPAAANSFEIYPSNSRLSFRGALGGGNTPGTSVALIQTTGNLANRIYSVNAGQLMNGDEVTIGESTYAVATTSASLQSNQIPLSAVLGSDNVAINTPVVHNAIGPIKVSVQADNINPGDVFFVYVQAASGSAALANDGLPDYDGFDFNFDAQIVCPGNATYVAEATPASNVSSLHGFSCAYAGNTTLTNQSFDLYINDLINPTPEIGQAINNLGIFNFLVAQRDQAGNNIFLNSDYVGLGNAVKMTVRVAPQLTFKIEGVGMDASACGTLTTTATTGTLVPFGGIGYTAFADAAQRILVNTNAANGYVITAIETDQMSLAGGICSSDGASNTACIPNYSTPGIPLPWNTVSGNFGFSMAVVSGDTYLNGDTPNVTPIFTYANGWSSFPDMQAGAAPMQIIQNLRSTNGDVIDVCYRIAADATTKPGEYWTSVTYTVTASF